MNKISFTIPNENKIVDIKPLELTKETNNINVNPIIINNNTNYKKIAPNIYKFCNGIK
jgi:hypothetical protein